MDGRTQLTFLVYIKPAWDGVDYPSRAPGPTVLKQKKDLSKFQQLVNVPIQSQDLLHSATPRKLERACSGVRVQVGQR